MLTKYFLGRAVRIDYLCVIYIYTNAKPEYIYNNQTIDKQNRLCDPRNIGKKTPSLFVRKILFCHNRLKHVSQIELSNFDQDFRKYTI